MMIDVLITYKKTMMRFFLLCIFTVSFSWAATVEQLQTKAIKLAKQGDVEQSYQELVLLHGRYPDNLPVLYDLIEIAARAGKLQQSFKYSQLVPNVAKSPTYVLEYMGKVTRNVGEYALSYRYYQILYKREAKADYLLGSVLATALSKQYQLADRSAWLLKKNYSKSIEYYLAKGFLDTQKKNLSSAVNIYNEGLERYPQHPELLKGLVGAYRQLNAASLADKIVKKHPKVFAKETSNAISGDILANRIRFSGAARFNLIDESNYQLETVSLLEQKIANAGGKDLRSQLDLIIAYNEVGTTTPAVELYESLLAQGVKIPAYVEAEVGEAYLDLQEPLKTIEIIQRIFPKKIPFDNQQILFYAYVESRQFNEAEELLQIMRKENPKYLGKNTFKIPDLNLQRVDIELRSVDVSLAKGDLAEAYDKVKLLSDEAPSDATIRAHKAGVEARRGWHEQAAINYGIATNLDPNRLETMIDSIDNDIYLNRYKQAGEKLYLLLKLRPHDRNILRARDSWEKYTGWQLSSLAQLSNNEGSVVDGEEVSYVTTLKAPLINNNIRPFISHAGSKSQLSNESFSSGRNIAGIELESYKTRITLGAGRGNDNELAANVGLGYRMNDHLRTDVEYEKNTVMPIQAARENITGDKVSGSATYRADERFSASAGISVTEFSDSNRRVEAFSETEKQLYSSPNYSATGRARADYASNKQIESTNYYNPRKSGSLLFSIDNNWLTHAYYDYQFAQNLSLGVGLSYEEGYGSDAIGRISYGHNWQFNQDLELFYNAILESRVYEDKRENNTNFNLGFNWLLH